MCNALIRASLRVRHSVSARRSTYFPLQPCRYISRNSGIASGLRSSLDARSRQTPRGSTGRRDASVPFDPNSHRWQGRGSTRQPKEGVRDARREVGRATNRTKFDRSPLPREEWQDQLERNDGSEKARNGMGNPPMRSVREKQRVSERLMHSESFSDPFQEDRVRPSRSRSGRSESHLASPRANSDASFGDGALTFRERPEREGWRSQAPPTNFESRAGAAPASRFRNDRTSRESQWEAREGVVSYSSMRDSASGARSPPSRERRLSPRRPSHSSWERATSPFPSTSNLPTTDFHIDPVPYTTAASEWLYGRRGILAALNSRKRKCYQLFYDDRNTPSVPAWTEIQTVAKIRNIPIHHLSRSSLDILVRRTSDDRRPGPGPSAIHDGLCLEASPYPQVPVDGLGVIDTKKHTYALSLSTQSAEDAAVNGTPPYLSYSTEHWQHKPLLLWLHGTVDMRNVGAIVRTAVYFGIDVILSQRGTAGNGFQKTSAGASEFVNLLQVSNPTKFIASSKEKGWKFYAAVAPRVRSSPQKDPVIVQQMPESPLAHHPCVLVVGNEDEGLPREFYRHCDRLVSVGGRSDLARRANVDSLNVGIAAAFLVERFCRKPTPGEAARKLENDEEKLFDLDT